MRSPADLRRRLAAGALLLAVLAAGGLHHHEDLTGALTGGAPTERVLSSHSPLSHDAHWHSGVQVKDDPCLACQSHRAAGLAPEPTREAPLSVTFSDAAALAAATVSAAIRSNGSRAPPALLS
jgi:hypothetical protein